MQTLLNQKAEKSVHKCCQPPSISASVDFRVGRERRCCGPKSGHDAVYARDCQPGREKRVLTSDEFMRMLTVLDLREKVIVRLATIEGMRPGEILALQVGDLELSEFRINVRRRLYRGNIDDPKTDRSKREVALSYGTLSLMKAWVDRLIRSSAESWVFECEHPGNRCAGTMLWKHICKRLKPIGMDWATFQVMRRTFASRGKESGIDAHTRSAQMGNTVDVNENEYAQSDFKTRLAAVRKFESTFVQ